MATTKSFLARVRPEPPVSRLIPWPLHRGDGEAPRVRVRALSHADREAAYLATLTYFEKKKRRLPITDPAFLGREQIETIARAYTDPETGDPIGTADELAGEAPELREQLYAEWLSHQADQAVGPLKPAEVDQLIEELKKKPPSDLWSGCASTWLSQLVRTLVDQLATSATGSSGG